jgi:hypothetical protein
MKFPVMANESSLSKFEIPPDVPARPVRWTSAFGAYQLEELTHPCHLLEEGRAMKHCIGLMYDDDPRRYGLEPGEAAATPLLKYWVGIEDGNCRIFSFTGAKGSLVTVAVSISARAFSVAEVSARRGHRLNGTERFHTALCAALDALPDIIRLPARRRRSPKALRLDVVLPRPSCGRAPKWEDALARFKVCCDALEAYSSQPQSRVFDALCLRLEEEACPSIAMAQFLERPGRFGPIKLSVTKAELSQAMYWMWWLAWLIQVRSS